jgi:hypothetical protein
MSDASWRDFMVEFYLERSSSREELRRAVEIGLGEAGCVSRGSLVLMPLLSFASSELAQKCAAAL